MTNKFFGLLFMALLCSLKGQAAPLLSQAELVKLSMGDQTRYLQQVQHILGQSAKHSELFSQVFDFFLPQAQSAEVVLKPENFTYSIEALLKGLPVEKNQKNRFRTLALAKIYLWHAQKQFPSYDFAAIEKEVNALYNPEAVKDLVQANELEEAYLQQGNATQRLAKTYWNEYKRFWTLLPGKGQVIITPDQLQPLGPATETTQLEGRKPLKFNLGRCLYGGFVVEGTKCQAQSQLPDYLKSMQPEELNHFSCQSPTPVLCNPLIFGCRKSPDAQALLPICVLTSSDATARCERNSDANATICALDLIKRNPSSWDELNLRMEKLCLPENLSQNGFVYFKMENSQPRSNASRKRALADLQETCKTTIRLLDDLKGTLGRSSVVTPKTTK